MRAQIEHGCGSIERCPAAELFSSRLQGPGGEIRGYCRHTRREAELEVRVGTREAQARSGMHVQVRVGTREREGGTRDLGCAGCERWCSRGRCRRRWRPCHHIRDLATALVLEHGGRCCLVIMSGKRRGTSNHLEHETAERPPVDTCIVRLLAQQFGGLVQRRAHQCALLFALGFRCRKAKVGEAEVAICLEEQVLRLEVAICQAGAMQGLECQYNHGTIRAGC
mmetsp:Transcript_11959/g.30662  ORF Transcript_11959/g.30662 Transcript_11959/m.30662 type:complete len:224 (+) Transcript_11959:826-1497(+)